MVIRDATFADLSALVLLNEVVHLPHLLDDPSHYKATDPTEVGAWFAEHLRDDASDILVAERDGRIVGYALLNRREYAGSPFTHPRRQLYVDQMAVSKDVQRQGVGRALLAAVRERAEGCSVELDVRLFNDGAVDFYESVGFERLQLRMRGR